MRHPNSDAEDGDEWQDIDQVVQDEIKNSTSFQGWNVRDKQQGRKIDLACAGRLKERDVDPIRKRHEQETHRLSFFDPSQIRCFLVRMILWILFLRTPGPEGSSLRVVPFWVGYNRKKLNIPRKRENAKWSGNHTRKKREEWEMLMKLRIPTPSKRWVIKLLTEKRFPPWDLSAFSADHVRLGERIYIIAMVMTNLEEVQVNALLISGSCRVTSTIYDASHCLSRPGTTERIGAHTSKSEDL